MYKKEITFDVFVRGLFYSLLAVGIFMLLSYLSSVLLPFAIGWLFAYLLYPIVKFVQYRLHVGSRMLSIFITLVFVLAVITCVMWLIIPPMVEQFEKLGTLIGNYLQQEHHIGNIPEAISNWLSSHSDQVEKVVKSRDFNDMVKAVVPQVFAMVSKTANIMMGIAGSLIALLYMFFILKDYEYLTDAWIKIFPKRTRPFWRVLASDAARELNNYLRGQSLVALTMGILFCIGFTIIDFPMAIGLGILIGIMDMVPYLHTLALIPTVFLALLKAADTGQNFWIILIAALAVFAIVQVIIDMAVTPKIMGKAMNLNPAILLLSLSVWGVLLGFMGLIIALPLTTLLMAYYQRYITREDEPEIT